ncbi:hypothetical protein PM082_019762 [Marasmius tenuissimus]|nr:hypothetical protein PM082_019762 [Marasmius tenuissimus]
MVRKYRTNPHVLDTQKLSMGNLIRCTTGICTLVASAKVNTPHTTPGRSSLPLTLRSPIKDSQRSFIDGDELEQDSVNSLATNCLLGIPQPRKLGTSLERRPLLEPN